ncbi:MAG: helix-turn-helix transcriptional regulator, partial [Chloroflexota bacterium]
RVREQAASAAERQAAPALTARETEVLGLMAQGLDTRAIAERLVLGISTVRSHAQSVIEKLGAHSRLEAVARAGALGLIRGSGPGDR